jgi:serine-threonine kinase receptor-associated protein
VGVILLWIHKSSRGGPAAGMAGRQQAAGSTAAAAQLVVSSPPPAESQASLPPSVGPSLQSLSSGPLWEGSCRGVAGSSTFAGLRPFAAVSRMGTTENAYVVAASEGITAGVDFVRQIPIVCPGHSRAIVELQFSPETVDGVFLLSACLDKQPMLRNATTGDWIGTFEGHNGAVWAAHMDPTAHRVVTGSADMSAKVWDAITGDEIYSFPHPSVVKAARITQDAKRMITGGYDKVLRVFDLEKPESTPTELKGCGSRITRGEFLGAGDMTVLTAEDGGKEVKVWDLRAGAVVKQLATVEPINDTEVSYSTAGDKPYLVVAAGQAVQFWDATTFELVKKVEVGDIGLQAASLHPGRGRFVCGGLDMAVRVFDWETEKLIEEHRGHHGPMMSARFSPSGETYATGADDATVRIWQTFPPKPADAE